jgi:hypothetical protein
VALESALMASAELTANTNVAVVLPVVLLAVTVYVACAEADVGVPPITPVVLLKESPSGSAGLIE